MSDAMQQYEQDPRWTAYVLGELSESERREAEAEIARDAQLAEYVAELEQVAGIFGEALELPGDVDAEDLRLTAEQRRSLEHELKPAGPSRKASSLRWWRPAAAVAVAASLTFVTLQWLQTESFRGLDVASAPAIEYEVTDQGARWQKPEGGPMASPRSRAEALMSQGYASAELLESLGYPGAEEDTLSGLGYLGGDDTSTPDASELRSLGYIQQDFEAGAPSPSEWRPMLEVPADGRVVVKRGSRTTGRSDAEDYRETKDWLSDAAERMDQREPSNREGYRPIYENDFLDAADNPLSTFAVDVDAASYANVRRILREGRMPPPDAVRIAELVNYFPYSDPAPEQGAAHPIAVHIDSVNAPWRPQNRLVRVALTTRALDLSERRPSNLVFLFDVSGSMNSPEKLPLLKRAFSLLVQQLDERDRVSIVVYAGAAGVVLEPTSGDAQGQILSALERLQAGGSTNGGQGIRLAYNLARQHFLTEGINRVILATDGDFNVGVSDDGSLVRMIQEEAATGVFLTVLGFGRGNLQDAKMEQIANKGNGTYGYIDSLLEARRLLVDQLGATLEVIGKDVKLQVEFNPNAVAGYRLIGYENRLMAAQDFADDKKDGGEMGAGHRVTALYEVVPKGQELPGPEQPDLKYQGERLPTGDAFSGELLTVNVRYKRPAADTSVPFSVALSDAGGSFDEASEDTRFAASVAAFGMLLRGSSYAGEASYESVRGWAQDALAEDPGGYRREFLSLIDRARELTQ